MRIGKHERHRRLRQATGWVLSLLLTLFYFSPSQVVMRTLPERLTLTAGQTRTLPLGGLLTATAQGAAEVSASEDETLGGSATLSCETAGTSEIMLKWLGLLPAKKVEVEVSPARRLVPGGMAIGVALHTAGVVVVGLSDLAGGASPARSGGILPGDVLLRMDGVELTSSAQLALLVAQAGERELPVELEREGQSVSTSILPKVDGTTGTARIGAWVRDSTAGVGTLSFYDPENGSYAALGHAITDGDTGRVLPVSQGEILKASVVAVQKGQKGAPGELKGSFLRENEVLGNIARNGVLGIYGRMETAPTTGLYADGLPVGLRSGVHEGAASILSCVDGETVREYAVEITRANRQSEAAPKSMVLRVTDEALLEKTGGIVQGMSGSPILQDGRIIGAVTHVFVGDPTQGYGLYIDWMLEEAGKAT